MLPSIIVIDGPAASGKTTIGCLLAERLGYLFFDTGVLYRAVTLVALARRIPIADAEAITRLAELVQIDVAPPSVADGRHYDVLADGRDITWQIRKPEVDGNVSQVSAYPGVRRAVLDLQRRIGRRGRVVVVGRDIGTVVLPEAQVKIYLDASLEERARRRYEEQLAQGMPADHAQVRQNLQERDRIDSSRETAPLRQAEDATYVDSTGQSIEEVLNRVLALVEAKSPVGGRAVEGER